MDTSHHNRRTMDWMTFQMKLSNQRQRQFKLDNAKGSWNLQGKQCDQQQHDPQPRVARVFTKFTA